MKIDLFSIPIWIGNIDASKIIVNDTNLGETFRSNIETSFSKQNNISDDSLEYLYSVIIKLLNRTITSPYNIELGHIWNNYYKSDDFQHFAFDFLFSQLWVAVIKIFKNDQFSAQNGSFFLKIHSNNILPINQ